MQKKLLLVAAILFAGLTTIYAQNGNGFQHQTVQERVANTMSKLTALKLDSATTIQADSIFTNFYTAQQKAMQDMMSGGQMDRDAMRQKRQELTADRDSRLKAIFTADQYNNWINNIEPSLRPQRGNRQNAQ